jgi:hypothetical protein
MYSLVVFVVFVVEQTVDRTTKTAKENQEDFCDDSSNHG